MTPSFFKTCSTCSASWLERDDFLSDAAVVVTGYQTGFTDPCRGFFLFDHVCGTTMALKAAEFSDLCGGEVLQGCRRLLPEGGACAQAPRACPSAGECSFVLEVLRVLRDWPKFRGVAVF